jgi:hypothetical protein
MLKEKLGTQTHTHIYIFKYIYINLRKHKGHFGHDRRLIGRLKRRHLPLSKKEKGVRLPNPSVEKQITIAFQTNTSLEETFKSIALPIETIDDLGTYIGIKIHLYEKNNLKTYQV